MKKHKHDALIRAWLDNGMPQVECRIDQHYQWTVSSTPQWQEDMEYRLVYPPKPKKQIKMLCWYDQTTRRLLWVQESACVSGCRVRVPAQDITIEVEE